MHISYKRKQHTHTHQQLMKYNPFIFSYYIKKKWTTTTQKKRERVTMMTNLLLARFGSRGERGGDEMKEWKKKRIFCCVSKIPFKKKRRKFQITFKKLKTKTKLYYLSLLFFFACNTNSGYVSSSSPLVSLSTIK